MISFTHKGDFSKTKKYFENLRKKTYLRILEHYGKVGVDALSAATPVDSGHTASSWTYSVEESGGVIKLIFSNTNINKGVPIAIILQHGHGTGTGGWVEGRD